MLDKSSNVKSFQSFILEWNLENPVDRWWRSKHGVAFNSSLHREVSFIDMYMEFYEDSLYEKAVRQNKKKIESPYIPGSHDFLYEPEYSVTDRNEITEEEFDNIEI